MFFSPLSCFIFGYMADFVGRRKAMFLLVPLGILGFFLSYFGNEFTLFLVGNCCLSSFLQSMVMLIYLYTNEILGRRLRSRSVALLGLAYAFGELVFLVFYEFMTSYKQVYLAQGVCILICIPIIRFLRESPFHLAHTKQFRKLSKMLKKIMETNFKNNVVRITRWQQRKRSKKLKSH
jgi:putative MFS transporter